MSERELANRLMLHGQAGNAKLPTAIFGTAGTVAQAIYASQPPVRIGLWPVVSTGTPQFGNGLFALLGYLLDRYNDARTYRLVAQVEGEPDTYEWEIGKSQFDADGWQIKALDDNVGIWGNLDQTGDNWALTLKVERDLVDDDDVKPFRLESRTLADMIGGLPALVADIARHLGIERKLISPAYQASGWQEDMLQSALERIFDWELKLYLYLWGRAWPETQMLADLEHLRRITQPLDDLGAWLVSNAVTRAITYMDASVESVWLPVIRDMIGLAESSHIHAIMQGTALFDLKLAQEAYEILGAEIEREHGQPLTYLALAELYRRGGRVDDAIDTLQAAIENDHISFDLYQRYADLLIAMEYNNLDYDTFVLIDPDEYSADMLLWEAVEAYQSALRLEPDNAFMLSRQLLQLVELDETDDRLWPAFGRLVNIDESGQHVRSVADAFYNLEDLGPALEILEQAGQAQPDRADIFINLAIIYTVEEDRESALRTLHQARQLTDSAGTIAEIDHLTLVAEDPTFEMRLGEIADILNASNELKTQDADFLEMVLEKAPTFAEAYVMLAKAYVGWDEESSALETLLDGHQQNPDDPEIITFLSERLWDSGEEELALNYLNKGLANNPSHVPLLARAGQYLFEDGQVEAAREYLARAEALAPRDPILSEVRAHIARAVGR